MLSLRVASYLQFERRHNSYMGTIMDVGRVLESMLRSHAANTTSNLQMFASVISFQTSDEKMQL